MLAAEQTKQLQATSGPQASQFETLIGRLDNRKNCPSPSNTPGHTFEALGEDRSQEPDWRLGLGTVAIFLLPTQPKKRQQRKLGLSIGSKHYLPRAQESKMKSLRWLKKEKDLLAHFQDRDPGGGWVHVLTFRGKRQQ